MEYFWHALYPSEAWRFYQHNLQPLFTIYRLLDVLAEHRVYGVFYCLGVIAKDDSAIVQAIAGRGHRLGSHGWAHQPYEREGDAGDQATRTLLPECIGYRPPYWNGMRRPGYGGGAFFRLLPYPLVKWEVQHSGELYVHPHDLDLHPGMLRRSFSLGDPWQKLERLLTEVTFRDPR